MKTHRHERCLFSSGFSSQRGVTLIELMVSAVLMVLVIGAAMAAFLTQNRLLQQRARVQQARDSARIAVTTIEQRLNRAGFGMGPEFAFFVGPDEDLVDLTDRPDELIFHSRSVRYFAAADENAPTPNVLGDAWQVANAAGTNLSLIANGSPVVLDPGQILLVLCPNAYTYTYVTVSDVADFTGASAGDQVNVSLRTHQNGDPFRQTNSFTSPCFNGGRARAFVIERFRFFVQEVDGRFHLFLDRGTAGADEQLVAPDIEDLQVVYILRDGSEWGGQTTPQATGLATGELSGSECPQSREITQAFYRDYAIAPCSLNTPRRAANHIGNIAKIRITVVARTPMPVISDRGAVDIDPQHTPSAFSVENRNRLTEEDDGFRRYRLTTVINLPSMAARGIPSI